MRLNRALIVAIMLIASKTAGAPYIDGATLLSLCLDPDDSVMKGQCIGFVIGVADAVDGMQDVHPLYKRGICVPPTASAGELVATTIGYSRRHKAEMHFTASTVVTLALRDAYPCR